MSKSYPLNEWNFNKKGFIKFLKERGAEVLDTINEWEVVRYKANGETVIIYRNSIGRLKYTQGGGDAYRAYLTGRPWRGNDKVKRRAYKGATKKTLLSRDGDICFFCQKPLDDDVTIEHIVPVTHGGPNHISNLVLAHTKCNQDADHLSAKEKIDIHVKARTLGNE